MPTSLYSALIVTLCCLTILGACIRIFGYVLLLEAFVPINDFYGFHYCFTFLRKIYALLF